MKLKTHSYHRNAGISLNEMKKDHSFIPPQTFFLYRLHKVMASENTCDIIMISLVPKYTL